MTDALIEPQAPDTPPAVRQFELYPVATSSGEAEGHLALRVSFETPDQKAASAALIREAAGVFRQAAADARAAFLTTDPAAAEYRRLVDLLTVAETRAVDAAGNLANARTARDAAVKNDDEKGAAAAETSIAKTKTAAGFAADRVGVLKAEVEAARKTAEAGLIAYLDTFKGRFIADATRRTEAARHAMTDAVADLVLSWLTAKCEGEGATGVPSRDWNTLRTVSAGG